MPNLLFVSGLPNDGRVEVTRAHPNGQVNYKYSGVCDFYNYLNAPTWRKKLIVLDTRDVPITLTPETHLLVNQMAEPDSHSVVLERLVHLTTQYPEIPVFNPPHSIMQTRRDLLAESLQDIEGLVVPRTLRIQPRSSQAVFGAIDAASLSYPVILKAAGQHGGKQTVLLKGPEPEALYPVALDGRPYYLIDYIDSAVNGVYQKFRLVMVQGRVYPHHFRTSDQWLVHFHSAQTYMDQQQAYYTQEMNFFKHFERDILPQVQAPLKALYERLPLDFVGIDACLLPDGQLLLFEANANMLIFRTQQLKLPYFEPVVAQIREAAVLALNNKLRKA